MIRRLTQGRTIQGTLVLEALRLSSLARDRKRDGGTRNTTTVMTTAIMNRYPVDRCSPNFMK
jgi:hypothetical protein